VFLTTLSGYEKVISKINLGKYSMAMQRKMTGKKIWQAGNCTRIKIFNKYNLCCGKNVHKEKKFSKLLYKGNGRSI
jgi:hypothetical protein